MDRVPPTDAQDIWSVAADEHRHEAESLLHLAFLASGDAGTAIVAVEDSFVRLLRRRAAAPVDREAARRALRRSVLAVRSAPATPPSSGPAPRPGSRPDTDLVDDDADGTARAIAVAAAVRALARRQRDAVLLHEFVGLADRSVAETLARRVGAVRRDLHRGVAAVMGATGVEDAAAVADALRTHAADLGSAPPPWESIVARAAATRRGRRRSLLVAAGVTGVVLVLTALPGGGSRAGRRLALDGRIGVPVTTAPVTLPPVVAVLTDGRVVQLDGADGRATGEIGGLSGSPLVPGRVDLGVTRFEVLVAVHGDAPAIVGFGGGRNGSTVVTGHSPAPAADGRLAWVDEEGGADVAIVVRDGGADRRWPLAGAGAGETAAAVTSLSWAPDGRRLAFELRAPGVSPEVRVLDTSTPAALLDAPRLGPWRSPRWLPDGDLVVVDATGTLVSIVDPDSMQALSNRLDGAPAAGVDADTRGDLLAVHTDGVLTVNGRVVLSSVAAAAWRP